MKAEATKEVCMDIDTYKLGICVIAIIWLYVSFFASKKFYLFKKLFLITTIVYNLFYLFWRFAFTIPWSFGIVGLIIGLMLFSAELIGFLQALIFRILFFKPFNNIIVPIEEFQELPTVDVFIATYNESMKILKKTIVACKNLDYPPNLLNVYLCDDGRRIEAEQLCKELGVHYIKRYNNEHAKAGNINNALSKTNGQFVMLLDADMVPKSNFLQMTLGHFVDESVGFVQTPQVFYNPDPFQHNLKFDNQIPNEQDFFMQDIQGGRANYNAVLHVGTNAVFRRSALNEIGGIPTGSITEDMATGMLLEANGYKGIFVKNLLATGLSVESYSDLIKQRERWCRGNIQVNKKWNPLKIKGLSFMQRLIYLDGVIYWFSGVQKIIYILCPIIFLIFGTVILEATIVDLILFWLPSFLASILTFRSLSFTRRTIAWSHIYEVAMAPYLALASLYEWIFARPIPFKVTPKGNVTNKTEFKWKLALPHIVLLVLTIAGWIITFTQFNNNSYMFVNLIAINMFWSVYNVSAIIVSILICFERPRVRADERINTEESLMVKNKVKNCETVEGKSVCKVGYKEQVCEIKDLSESGARIQCTMNNKEVAIDDLPAQENGEIYVNIEGIGNLKGTIKRSISEKDIKDMGIKFDGLSDEEYDKLVKKIYDNNKGYHIK